ncbi:MAG: hypothetical protein ACRDBG_26785, partial [Waterburya sp.]
LSANIKTYEAFLIGIDSCKAAALDRLNNGIKDTDNPKALEEAQALQQAMEEIVAAQEASEPSTAIESEVLLPAWN